MATVFQANLITKDYADYAAKLPRRERVQFVQNQPSARWRPPNVDVVKVNTDASFNRHSNIACVGVIARDFKGHILFGITKKFPATSPLLAEALALREAVAVASNFGVTRVLFENDNLNLINACRGEDKWGEIQTIIQDISLYKTHFQKVGFTWVEIRGNAVAHQLAHLAMTNSLPLHWRWSTPPSLQDLIAANWP